MLEVKNLTFAYGDHLVLDDISFSLDKGEMIAVLGANGAGKSTMFRCILGLFRKYQGDVLFGGKSVLEMSRRELAQSAAYIPQAEAPVFNYTVMDTVLMGTTGTLSPVSAPGEDQIQVAKDSLCALGIDHLAERGIQEISGGERQLAFLARALAQQSGLFVMDEPTANLDYGNQQLVLRHVKKLTDEGYTVLMSTHNPEHALQYASKVMILKDRELFAYGDAADVLTEETIEQVYGMRVVIIHKEIEGKEIRSCIPVP